MCNKFQDIDIKNHTYYFFDDMIKIKSLDPNKIMVDQKSYKNFLIYYIRYVTFEDLRYLKIHSVNPSFAIINEANGYFEEINENKYFTLVSTNESKEIM